MSTGDYCTCPTVWHGIIPPPLCPSCAAEVRATPYQPTWPTQWQPTRLSDEDVERVARRVVELLKTHGR